MAGINLDSIMKKVNAYALSKEGKEKIDSRIAEIRTRKNGRTDGGGYVTTFKDMEDAAVEMENTARTAARGHKLPDSVLEHFDSLRHTEPYLDRDGRYRVDIYFDDNLYRPSLVYANGPKKGMHTGDGIDNIVSLFDTGYTAKEHVYGLWPGHEDSGIIRSRTSREPIGFMSESVDDFNRLRLGRNYRVVAIIPESDSDIQFYIR